ncbi:unnamed protein product, partial [Allacma fusca]
LSNSGAKNSTDTTTAVNGTTTGASSAEQIKFQGIEAHQKMFLAEGSNTISPYENFENTDYFYRPDLHNTLSPDFDYKIPSFVSNEYVNDYNGDVPGESDYSGGFGSIEF